MSTSHHHINSSGVDRPTIFQFLRNDHDTQRSLLALVEKTQGNSEERRTLYGELRAELLAHAAAEERALYSPMLAESISRSKASHSIAEHKEAEDLIKALDETPMDSPAWLVTFKKLAHEIRHHVDEEEREVFQIGGKVLDPTQQREAGAQFTKMKATYGT